MVDYERIRKEQPANWRAGKYIGVGIANTLDSATTNFARVRLANSSIRSSGSSEGARISIDDMGKVTVAIGPHASGQGYETSCAMVVADELGINPDDVNVVPVFDSFLNPYTSQSGSYASRFVVMGIGAVLGALKKMKTKLLRIASHVLAARVEDLEFKNGGIYIRGSEKHVSLADIGNLAYQNVLELPEDVEPGLLETYFYKADFGLPSSRGGNFMMTYSSQVHVAVVEVDLETGEVSILKYAIVDDCGTVINPLSMEGQLQGAAAHGIGASLYEEFRYDESGQLITSTLMDYLAPTACELPNIEIEHVVTPSPRTKLGQKGMGEGGGAPVPAIANAVDDALRPFRVKIVDSHITPEQLFWLAKNAPRSPV